MKITKQVSNEVITQIAGEDTIQLVEYLRGKKNISEFIIANDLELEINYIRNMLYRLLDHNLVSFTRKKDKQKGWYIYYWTFNPIDIEHKFWEIKRKRKEALIERIHREKSNVFFSGPSKAVRLTFEKAIEFNYQCPETGEMLIQEDNSQKIQELEKELSQLEEELQTRPIIRSDTPKTVKKTPTKKKATTKKTVKKATKKTVKKKKKA
ncbi:MAG: hypothetical protein ACMXYF_02920 [Candidatus Woesearchaeota archaeon]